MRIFKKHLVTAALPYANGPLHIGHLAGAYLSSDIYVRFLRLMDKDVVFVCGSDEHGAAITIKALKEKTTPQEIVDKYHDLFKDTFEKIGVSFDIYHRTSSQLHHETSREFFKKLYEKGEFVEKTNAQYYDEKAKQFLADRYIKGTCPKCAYEEAYGDQCENCGTSLSPADLIDPVSTLTGEIPVLKETTHWYLPLNKYEDWLKEWISTGVLDGKTLHDPSEWKNHVLGQCKSWLDAGLAERSMTRDLTWGVDMPADITGSTGKKLYVWMDAPIGYISATKQWAKEHNASWEPYWQDENTALVHFIGKDNIVFHCLIFPAILKAHGQYILPINVPANQFMNLEGRKLSTSKNWAIWVHEYLEDMPGKEDVLRYALIKNMPELKDSEFTWKGFQDANNNELVNNLANFVNRVVVLTNKFFDGTVPAFDENKDISGCDNEEELSFHDSELLRLYDNIDTMCTYIRQFDFRNALKTMMEISSQGNQILQFNAPWKAIKDDMASVQVVLNLLIQYVAALSVVSQPFLPFTSEKMRKLLNLPPLNDKGELLELCDKLANGELLVPLEHKISAPEHLFSRIEDDVINAQLEKLKAAAQIDDQTENPVKSTIDYEQFIKMDMRTGTILSAEKVEKADKLLKLSVDLGFETRTVVSGIAQHYAPDDIVGQKVVVLANLAPRKIRGIESKGMILMAENKDGKLYFVGSNNDSENGLLIS